jgi:hypothetical protein
MAVILCAMLKFILGFADAPRMIGSHPDQVHEHHDVAAGLQDGKGRHNQEI